MASILSGYAYDIFISYRQNDNRSGWVTEFVKSLQEELSATIKEPVSVYFDSNPHDGLLETHNVDKSLEGKLKCLIFIPIISQTYCDVNCFAWRNEFLAFNRLLKEDQFGRDIKLAGGNVAGRILPVKIHELDASDKSVLEKELGGVLRSVDFIFRSAGVNRPLRSKDDDTRSPGQILYHDQMNKTANAIKDLISALTDGNIPGSDSLEYRTPHDDSAIPAKPKNSIAVLPFANMSNDPDQDYLSHGIAEEIINSLANLRDLKVAGRMSSFQFNGKQGDLREVGKKLGVSTILEGSVRKQGNHIRVTVQLINVEDGFHIWSQKYDRVMDDIFAIEDEIALTVTEKLRITLLEKERDAITKSSTQNAEAYEIYLRGRFYVNTRSIRQSIEQFQQAIILDPRFSKAYAGLADAYILSTRYGLMSPKEIMPRAKEAADMAIKLDPSLCEPYCSLGLYFTNLGNWAESKKHFLKSIELNPQYSQSYLWYGHYYLGWVEGKFEEAKRHIQKSIELEPLGGGNGNMVGILHSEGKYEEALTFGKRGVALDPTSYIQQRALGLCYLLLKQYDAAAQCLEYACTISNRSPFSLVDLIFLHTSRGQNDKASIVLDELTNHARGKHYTSPIFMAFAFGHTGQVDKAFEWLEKSYEESELNVSWLKYYPWVPAALRQHPRFQELLSKMNFPA